MNNLDGFHKVEIPNFLYHYTNLTSLASILQNQTIQFSSLATLNDLTEMETADYGEFGNYTFVSCWTYQHDEQIPLWNMYAQNMTGVRIGLPADPFTRYTVKPNPNQGIGTLENCIVPYEELLGKNYTVNPFSYSLFKVTYTDNKLILKPKIYEVENGQRKINFDLIGRNKSMRWQFENECRYILVIIPSVPYDPKDKKSLGQMTNAWLGVFKKQVLPFKKYFLNIRPDAFEKMEILLGPKHTDGDIAIAKALINTYNPKAQFKISELTGTIR
jgi:hypothetical protein